MSVTPRSAVHRSFKSPDGAYDDKSHNINLLYIGSDASIVLADNSSPEGGVAPLGTTALVQTAVTPSHTCTRVWIPT